MKKAIFLLTTTFIIIFLLSFCKRRLDYKNPDLSVDQRVESLLQQMTLDEKIKQLECVMSYKEIKDIPTGIGHLAYIFNSLPSSEAIDKYNQLQKYIIEHSRLGIPALYHSVSLCGPQANGNTVFPQPLAQAATWDPELITKMAGVCVLQTKGRGYRHELSPTINIAYDSRWGRTHETYGEDPLLTSMIAGSFVRVFEKNNVVVAIKHFAANIGQNGKFGGQVDLSERFLREIEFVPFKYCIQQCHAKAIMPAYNDINAIPTTINKWLLIDVLRKEWNFDGFVESDYGDIDQLVTRHHVAIDNKDAGIKAINSGVDVEFPDPLCFNFLKQAVAENLVSEDRINEAVRRVLKQKFRIGLFENPYADPKDADHITDNPDNRALARKIEQEAIVLLKNNQQLLPLSKNIKSIAVLGPLADDVKLGNYAGWGQKTVSILEGIKNALPKARVYYEQAANFGQSAMPVIQQTWLTTDDGKPGLTGEYFIGKSFEGTPAVKRIDPTIDFNWSDGVPEPHLPADHFCIRWTGRIHSPVTGKFNIGLTMDDGARLYIDDKLVVDNWINGSERLVIGEFNFTKDKSYPIKIEYFENTYKAVCKLGWDVVKTDLRKAVELVKKTDAAVLVVGCPDGEGRDRSNLDLNESQEDLIKAVIETGKPFTVILATGNVITMHTWIDKTPAIIHAWYGGEEMGNAVADVLFGTINPEGKLPLTIPRFVGQLPLTYYSRPSGASEDYIDLPGTPQFPFGFGLSYTSFQLKNMNLSDSLMKPGDSIIVTCQIKNTGNFDGAEVVQLYLHRDVASVVLPEKILRGFKKVFLKKNEEKNVSFVINTDMLKLYNIDLKWVLEPGIFDLLVGTSSDDIRMRKQLFVR